MNRLSDRETKALYNAILLLKNADECRRFFRDLLTQAEIKEFANRWKVAQMLDQKIQYEIIEKETGMSSTTIARVQKWLTKGKDGYRLMLNRFKKQKD
jgi:TrpR-related protein YerC/YecD